MPFLHPLFPYSLPLLYLRLFNALLSLSSLCLFIGAISTFNTTMLHYPDPNPPSSNRALLTTPDTVDVWPSLSLAWSLVWSLAHLLAQRRTVTALSSPLHVTEGLASLRRVGAALGVMVGDVVTWIVLVCLISVEGVYAAPFYTVYVDAEGTTPCPHYIPKLEPQTLSYYCANGFRVTANLELVGLVLACAVIVGHVVCSWIGWMELSRRMRKGGQIDGAGIGMEIGTGTGTGHGVGGVELGVGVGVGAGRGGKGKER
ncbi:MAG: hypothetical protein Q9160_007832 [Pyrenula sp. 1 TL-2023]